MTVAPAALQTRRRHALTVAECAARWKISEGRAGEWLRDFEARGFAECRRGGYWRATERARQLHLEGDPL